MHKKHTKDVTVAFLYQKALNLIQINKNIRKK